MMEDQEFDPECEQVKDSEYEESLPLSHEELPINNNGAPNATDGQAHAAPYRPTSVRVNPNVGKASQDRYDSRR